MGATLTKEHLSVWDLQETKEWKESAAESQRNFYLGFGGTQWHEYGDDDLDLLRTKVCYSIYGPPTEPAKALEEAYTQSQRNSAAVIRNTIVSVSAESRANVLRVGIIFVSCFPEGEKEFIIPLFRVYAGSDNGDLSKYVDTECRVYKNWNDWKDNNRLPMLKYCYPKNGFYTFDDDHKYRFDEHKEPCLGFGTSPACDLTARLAKTFDVASSIGGLTSGGIAIASIFTGVAPILLTGSAIVGGVSAVYGTGRSVDRLVDKGTHDQSLNDLESVTCWVAIAAVPLSFASSVVNGTLATCARMGTISSSSLRTTATVLNLARIGTDSTMLLIGISNLIAKSRNNQLEMLDVLQVSMSVFFFGHTLVQPITANGVIKQAQQQHIEQYRQAMTEADTKQSFQNFLDKNGEGSIKDNSKIIRTINRIDNPDGFFKGVGTDSVTIGGRKGKTVIIKGQHGAENRVNPNRVSFEARPSRPIDFNLVRQRLATTGHSPEDIQLNGKHIFGDDLSEHQQSRLKNVFENACRNYNSDIIDTSITLAESLGANTVDQFICVTEAVAVAIKGQRKETMKSSLNNLRGSGRQEFVQSFKADMETAMRISENAKLSFADPYKAVYHYRKHGHEFPSKLSNRMDIYLNKVPATICQDRNLTNINKLSDGTILKSYIDTSNNGFAVVASNQDGSTLATTFKNAAAVRDFESKLATSRANRFQPNNLNREARNLAEALGYASIEINLILRGGKTQSLQDCITDGTLTKEDARRLATMLTAMA